MNTPASLSVQFASSVSLTSDRQPKKSTQAVDPFQAEAGVPATVHVESSRASPVEKSRRESGSEF